MRKALSVFAALMIVAALIMIFTMPSLSRGAQRQPKSEPNETQTLPVESAIEQAKKQADIEKTLNATLRELGISCGFFIGTSVKQCSEFVKRVRSDPRLSHAVRQAKKNQITVVPGNFFDISGGIVYVDRNASTEKIVEFMLYGKK